jgi:hypothetical protein
MKMKPRNKYHELVMQNFSEEDIDDYPVQIKPESKIKKVTTKLRR